MKIFTLILLAIIVSPSGEAFPDKLSSHRHQFVKHILESTLNPTPVDSNGLRTLPFNETSEDKADGEWKMMKSIAEAASTFPDLDEEKSANEYYHNEATDFVVDLIKNLNDEVSTDAYGRVIGERKVSTVRAFGTESKNVSTYAHDKGGRDGNNSTEQDNEVQREEGTRAINPYHELDDLDENQAANVEVYQIYVFVLLLTCFVVLVLKVVYKENNIRLRDVLMCCKRRQRGSHGMELQQNFVIILGNAAQNRLRGIGN